jgi:shikimate dehydrogenase
VKPSRLVILGDPVAQSLSPKFQNAALRAAGIDLTYESMQVRAADLARVANELAAEGAAGNVTVPHKKSFLPLCAELSPIASRVGAVNTFWTSNGRLSGDNTDVGGFDAAAKELLGENLRGITIAVIGAGGATAAVLGAVEGWDGAKVRLYSRRVESANELAARFGDFVRVESSASDAMRGANFVVNATPVGMTGNEMPFSLEDVSAGARILDIVYRAGGTPLVNAARSSGFIATDGTAMLIEQGALAFERWFGFPPDKKVMYSALK